MALKKTQETRYRNVNSIKMIEKNIMSRKMMDQLSELIANVKAPGPYESTTRLYRKLVRKLRPQIAAVEADPEVCDITVRKLAKFVEDSMREACMLEKSKIFIASRQELSTADKVTSEIYKLQTRTKRPVHVKKIPQSIAENIPRTGPIYTATVGGQRVYVEDIRKGEQGRALITMPQSDKVNGEWSSWLIDIQADTSDWIRWLDNRAMAFDSDLNDRQKPSGSSSVDCSRVSQKKDDDLKTRRLFFDTPSTEKFWSTATHEYTTSSRSTSSIDLTVTRTRLRTPMMKPRIAEKKLSFPEMSYRPKTASESSTRAQNSSIGQQLKGNKNLDFRVLYAPSTSKKAGGIVLRD